MLEVNGACLLACELGWSGPLFRTLNRHSQVLARRLSGEGVALIVKRHVERLGYNPAAFAGHSLRAGLATSAAVAGKSERAIMNQTGHRSVTTVRRYIRDGDLFRENAADKIRSLPIMVKNPWNVSTVRSLPTQSRRVRSASIW